MILSSIPQVASSLLARLLEPAARSLALGCMVGLAFTISRARSVSLRLHVWKAVLCVALAMPLLGAVLPELSWNVPSAAVRRAAQLLPQAELKNAASSDSERPIPQKLANAVMPPPGKGFTRARGRVALATTEIGTIESKALEVPQVQSVAALRWNFPRTSWMPVAAAIYLSVVLISLASIAVGLFFGRRLDRASWPIHDTRATTLLSLRARAAGIQRLPRLAESELLSVPVTFGVLRPSVLLPVGWREWDASELDAVISHARSSGLARSAGGSIANSPSWPKKPATKLRWPPARTARVMPKRCWAFSPISKPPPGALGGREWPWLRQGKLKNDSIEFSDGKGVSPCK